MSASDYMSTPEEKAKQPAAEALCRKIAGAHPVEAERAYVFNALWSFWCFEHAWDDLMDGKALTPEGRELASKALYCFVDDLLLNPFITAHRMQVRSLLINALCKSMEGDALARSDDPAKVALSSAVRCADIDVFRGFAELVGGWELVRELAPLWDYDQNEKG